MKTKKQDNKSEDSSSNIKWIITVLIVTFLLSLLFSYISTEPIKKLNLFPAIIILFAVLILGVIFDIIAVAVTVAEEENFHAKATKKVKGAKTSVKLIRNSHKVSNFCADVIGDICGVLSGAISAIIASKIAASYNISFNIQFIISAVVASLTVSGKAVGKVIAKKYSTNIVDKVSKFLHFFRIEKTWVILKFFYIPVLGNSILVSTGAFWFTIFKAIHFPYFNLTIIGVLFNK